MYSFYKINKYKRRYTLYLVFIIIERTCFILLTQRIYGLKPKTAKNNKFVENELGNWAYVNQITEKQILMLKKKKDDKSLVRNNALGLVRGHWFLNIFVYSFFSSPFSMEGLSRYIVFLGHLNPTLIIYLSPYLSTCPIRYPLWLFVSCVRRDNTVQRSSLHKCGQKNSYSAFNAVIAVFPLIFLSSLPSCTFMRHVPIAGTSWRVT